MARPAPSVARQLGRFPLCLREVVLVAAGRVERKQREAGERVGGVAGRREAAAADGAGGGLERERVQRRRRRAVVVAGFGGNGRHHGGRPIYGDAHVALARAPARRAVVVRDLGEHAVGAGPGVGQGLGDRVGCGLAAPDEAGMVAPVVEQVAVDLARERVHPHRRLGRERRERVQADGFHGRYEPLGALVQMRSAHPPTRRGRDEQRGLTVLAAQSPAVGAHLHRHRICRHGRRLPRPHRQQHVRRRGSRTRLPAIILFVQVGLNPDPRRRAPRVAEHLRAEPDLVAPIAHRHLVRQQVAKGVGVDGEGARRV